MKFTVNPLSNRMGAEVVGLDLAAPLDTDTLQRIRSAWLDHLLLVFRDQHLTPEEQIAFSRLFGPLEIHFVKKFLMPEHPEIYVLTNKMEKGEKAGKPPTPYWHSDLSYMAVPAKASLLYAREVPEIGGDTLYSNMYLAYDALPTDVKTRLRGLKAVHNMSEFPQRYAVMNGQAASQISTIVAEPAKAIPDAFHPVILAHPETGRKAIYVNEGFTTRILGIDQKESDELLKFLFAHCAREEFTYRHKWRQHDANLWDNRCALHSATGGFQAPMYRLMHRTTIGGSVPVLAD